MSGLISSFEHFFQVGQNKCQIKLFKHIINKSQPLLDKDIALSQVLGGRLIQTQMHTDSHSNRFLQAITNNRQWCQHGTKSCTSPNVYFVPTSTLIAPSQAPTSAHTRLEVASHAFPPKAYICPCLQATPLWSLCRTNGPKQLMDTNLTSGFKTRTK